MSNRFAPPFSAGPDHGDDQADHSPRLRFRFKLSQLRGLSAVAETGSVSAAARHLGVPESTVGTTLSALEAQLGFELLNRGAASRALSAKGSRFLPVARMVLAAAEDVDATIDRMRSHRRVSASGPRVRIAAVTSAISLLAKALEAVQRTSGRDSVLLDEVTYHEGLRLLRSGRCDLLVAPVPIEEWKGLDVAPLGEVPFLALLPIGHRLAQSMDLRWAQLQGSCAVLLDTDGVTAVRLEAALRSHRLGSLRFREHHHLAIVEAEVRAGGCIGVLPLQVPLSISSRGLVVRRLVAPVVTLPLHVASVASSVLSSKVLEVREALLCRLQPDGVVQAA